jgi:hypothetical protein
MRLNEPTARANTNIVNSLLSDETTYQSGSSSLDYKTKGNEKLTTTKSGKRKKQVQQQAEQQQNHQRRNAYPTRARESNGVPPKRYDFANIHDMDESELMTALRDDPEFAAEMKKYAEQASQKKSTPALPTTPPTRRSKPTTRPTGAKTKTKPRDRYYRSVDGNAQDSAEYPHHVRELMDSGVPVTQWLILLVLLAAGFYQMGKVLMGPPKKLSGFAKGKQKNKEKKKADTTKKTEPKNSKKNIAKRPAASVSNEKSEQPKKVTPAINSQQKTAKKKKKKGTNGAALKKEAILHPDVVSTDTDESTHEDDGGIEKNADAMTPPPTRNPPIHTEPKEDDGCWETVTKSRKATMTPVPQANDSPANVSKMSVDVQSGAVPTPDIQAEKENGVGNDEKFTKASKKKKKKKAKQQSALVEVPASNDSSSTDDDANYALQLQKEEEILAKSELGSDEEEVWEEVTTKKKKV